MSRAFVKEDDLEHAGIDIPERSISEEINYVTPNGLKILHQTVTQLESDRAQSMTDDSPSSKEKKMRIEREIRRFARASSAARRDHQHGHVQSTSEHRRHHICLPCDGGDRCLGSGGRQGCHGRDRGLRHPADVGRHQRAGQPRAIGDPGRPAPRDAPAP